MSQIKRRWYSPTKHLLGFFRYIVRRSKNPAIFLSGCIIYAIFDIYGVAHAPSVFRWLMVEINKLRKVQHNAKSTKKD